jgi:hypothetical protein
MTTATLRRAGIAHTPGPRAIASLVVIASGSLIAPAAAQFVNGDFETGTLTGWTVAPTVNGLTLVQTVEPLDIDGPGPLAPSPAAKFAVGQQGGSSMQEGIDLFQMLDLTQGTTYRVSLNWAAIISSNSENAEGGVFRLLYQNTTFATRAAGYITPTTPRFGVLTGDFLAQTSGPQRVGVRITRDYLAAPTILLHQWVDNFSISPLVLGACCLPTGPCATISQGDCAARGGIYRGDATPCALVGCPPPSVLQLAAPGALASTAGSIGTNTLTQQASRTYQVVYSASELPVLPGTALTGVTWRIASTSALASWPAQDATWADYEIRLSTSLNPPGSLSTSFAENIAPDAVTVRSGPLVIPALSFPGGAFTPAVNGWGPRIDFTTPFIYTGGDLLITIRHSGNSTGTNRFMDSIAIDDLNNGYGSLVQAISTSGSAATSGLPASAPVTRLWFSWNPTCYANCDESTTAPVLNVADFTCFLQRFAAGESYANCDSSTAAPILNVGDFTCFLQRFAQGCP